MHTSKEKDAEVNREAEVIVFGCAVPEEDARRFDAFNPAGNLFQMRLIRALKQHFSPAPTLVSAPPVSSWPDNALVYRPDRRVLEEGDTLELLPFLNWGPLKTVTVGLSAFFRLLRWGWRHRHAERKVVVSYNLNYPHALFLVPAARLAGARVVAVVADLWHEGRDSPLRRLDLKLQTRCMRAVDGLVVITGPMAEDHAPETPALVMNGGMPAEELRRIPEWMETEGGGGETFTLMYAGELSAFKTGLLLQAFRLLEGAHYRLLLTGRGPLQPEIEELAASDHRVRYLGFLDRYTDVLACYGRADLLLNTQRTDDPTSRYTFPSKLIEYLATGKPVVATATAGVRSEFSDYLWLLEEEHPRALADLVRRIESASPEEIRAKTEAARSYVVQNKSWEKQGKRVVDFLHSLLF